MQRELETVEFEAKEMAKVLLRIRKTVYAYYEKEGNERSEQAGPSLERVGRLPVWIDRIIDKYTEGERDANHH